MAETIALPEQPAPKVDPRRVSYGQNGQDIMLDFLVRPFRRGRGPGFYVDVGCAWPKAWSNTFFFYERHWRGICIDANPAMEAPFRAERPRDTYVNCGIAEQEGAAPFYLFGNPKFNTFDPSRAEARRETTDPSRKLLGVVDVPIRRLSGVLDEHLPPGTDIDVLSIDVENLELQVLRSLDFDRHRPSVIVLELMCSVQNALTHPVYKLLGKIGYRLIAHTGHDSFFVLQRKTEAQAGGG